MKKVKFSDKVIIHNLDDTDDFRKSAWEMYARDRLRFQKRISELRKFIDPVLNNETKNKERCQQNTVLNKSHSIRLCWVK
jgi:hypothetical protein